ncbi:uncharacterized protein LOC114297449 isoform X2 [Camellia sinensis]|uniref:uncharacterized protein LOC114297449 isoform X2 n=1 Tax=Camellia sinensis TaxID=4442 RepID=UPI001035EDD2|nr:uncharacterized protein LOC114297449 isoform X2 [Camellia sinensis]XP_028097687.1 uncharacterized protein LOC114297449 isoform X2 [Camellia sinensis]XP_028097688.1 uncharacterized protein LOC114297449 isoform X2 [Camellia sinensis]XP_028097689.1 uncharacterized protein LOC114297449 isoform X2 [Camellia sinensis]
MDWAVWDGTHGQDVIEENALNEKSCIQVLRILITKANNEILELEEDLVTLQSQLAWADESWSEICSASLREKIDCLDISIQSLKNTNVQDEHDFGGCLLLHREPAERMHEIVKAMLEKYFHQKDEQSVDVIVKESSSAGLQHGSDLMVQKKRLGCSASEPIIKEEVEEANIILAQRRVIFHSSLKSQGKKTCFPETLKHANSFIKTSSLATAAGLTNGKKILNKLDSVSNTKLEVSKYDMTVADYCMTQKSSPKTPVKRRNQEPDLGAVCELIEYLWKNKPVNSIVPEEDLSLKPKKKDVAEKGKPKCTIAKDSSSDQETDDSSQKKGLSKSGLMINGKNGLKTHNSASKERSEVLNSSLKPARKPRTAKLHPANASGSDASKRVIDPKGKNKLCRIDSKVHGHKEIKEHNSTDQTVISKSCLQHGGKQSNISETVELADHIVEFRSSALQEVSEESEVNPALSKAPDSPLTNMIDPLLSSFKTEKKRTKTPWRMKGPEAGLTDTEQNAADSLIELMYQKRKHITKQHPREEQKQKAKLPVNDNESNSSLHPKPQKQRAKREQQQKATPDSHADINVDSTLLSQKKRNCQSSPVLGETKKFKGLQITPAQFRADTAEYTAEYTSVEDDLCTAKCSSTGDNNYKTRKCLPSPTLPHPAPSGLEKHLTLVDLRAIAKIEKVKGYCKLTKAKLREVLSLKLMDRGGCT